MAEHSVGATIRQLREARQVSLRRFASMIEVSPATMSAIERDRVAITVDRLDQIAAQLDVTPSALLEGVVAARPQKAAVVDGDWRTFDELSLTPLLSAAIKLFVDRGFHATSMRDIASEAGLSVAGIYHHYSSKQQILTEILELTMAEIGWRMEAARLEGGGPSESFRLMVESLALFHAVRGDLAFIGASEMRSLNPDERVRIAGLRSDVQHALDDQAQKCVASDSGAAVQLRTATRAIATMCTSLPSWFRPSGELTAQHVAKSYASFAVALIDAGGAA